MNYITFRERFHDFACFSNEQVVAAFPRFDRGNFSTWLGKGYIRRLRRSWYDTHEEIEALRLDADMLEEISRDSALDGVVARFGSRALARRIRLVREVYAI